MVVVPGTMDPQGDINTKPKLRAVAMQQAEHFVSQTEWKPYGHLICTPVCLLAGTAFLNGLKLSPPDVRQMMCMSHNLYKERFAARRLPLKIQELYGLIPPHTFEIQEAAGMLLTKAAPGCEADDLLVMPLIELLWDMMGRDEDTCAIVTTMDHTTCYLAKQPGQLQVFDPLPASLQVLPHMDRAALEQALRVQYGPSCDSALFSAAVICRKPQL